jgi:hypothetical protein
VVQGQPEQIVWETLFQKKTPSNQALVAHTYNPSYSRGSDQEDIGSKPDWANSLRDTILKKSFTKKGLVEWLNE